MTMTKVEKTPTEAGLSNNEQLMITLRCIYDANGQAKIQEIYSAVEAHMGGAVLSKQGRASLRRLINHDAVSGGYIFPYDRNQPGWRITSRGENLLVSTTGLGIEDDEEFSTADEPEPSISRPYDPQRIKVDMRPYPIFQILRKIERKEIELKPEFQRNIVWNDIQQSRLIESILINLPLPALYLDASRDECWLVVDGLQRLWTLNRFCNQKNLRLKGLEFNPELDGKNWDMLPRQFQRRIEDTMLILYLIQPETPDEAKFTIFWRVNTGGMVLTPQEIRHAIYQGEATRLLQELAESDEFLNSTGGAVPIKRMADRELVLRFISFYFSRYLPDYGEYEQANWNAWLNDAMQYVNQLAKKGSGATLVKMKREFKESMLKAQLIFGPRAFRKINKFNSETRFPLNKSLFEVWAVLLVEYPRVKLEKHKDSIVNGFIELLDSPDFLMAITQGTGSKRNVQLRFHLVEQLLRGVVK
jgi:hypothetical protein